MFILIDIDNDNEDDNGDDDDDGKYMHHSEQRTLVMIITKWGYDAPGER